MGRRRHGTIAGLVLILLALSMPLGRAEGAPPTVTITQPPNGAWTGNSIVVSAVANDDTGVVKVELWGNGAPFHTVACGDGARSCSATTRWSTGALATGAYEINAVALDVDGGRTVSPTVTIFKNGTKPVHPSGASSTTTPTSLTAGFEAPANDATVCGSSVPIIMSAGGGSDPDNDGIVTRDWVLRIDGTIVFTGSARTPIAQQELTFSWDTTAYDNGPHAIQATVTDEEGHTATGSMTVNTRNADSIGLAITTPANGATVKGTTAVTLKASGGSCLSRSFTLSIDGEQVFAQEELDDTATYQWDTTTFADGPHTLTATVTDFAGHTAEATTTVTVSNSGGRPTATITVPADGAWTGASIRVAATASSGTPLASLKLYGNGGVFFTQACSGTTCAVDTRWSTSALASGAYQINAVATTTSGAIGVSPTVTIFKNAKSPLHPSGAPSGGGGTSSLTAWFGSPADGATVSGTVEVTMNAGNAQGSPTSFVLKLDDTTTLSSQNVGGSTATFLWNTATTSPGAHTLDLKVTDGAGRTATASIDVTVSSAGGGGGDTTRPTVVITQPSTGDWTGNSIRVIAEAADNVGLATLKLYGDGVQFAQASCAGSTTCEWDGWWSTSSLSSGKHAITAVATDLAGNTTTSAPVTINK